MASIQRDSCARCGDKANGLIVSKFNLDEICLPCKDDEQQAPGYHDADAAEMAACRMGDMNFPGVGLSAADSAYLYHRRLCRAKSFPCECVDRGCVEHIGDHCKTKATKLRSLITLFRIDMEDRTGTRFCEPCAKDASDSGLFAEERSKR